MVVSILFLMLPRVISNVLLLFACALAGFDEVHSFSRVGFTTAAWKRVATRSSLALAAVTADKTLPCSSSSVCPDTPTHSNSAKTSAVFIPDSTRWEKDAFSLPLHHAHLLESVLVPHGAIVNRVERLVQEIAVEFQGKEVHFLCVLKGAAGAAVFFHEFLFEWMKAQEKYHLPTEFDFIRVKSYERSESSSKVSISGMSEKEIERLRGKHVIVVEDIVGTGLTMKRLKEFMDSSVHPASMTVLSLIEKRVDKPSHFKADYVGFSVPNKFIVGYGMDDNEKLRDLRHIAVLNEKLKLSNKAM